MRRQPRRALPALGLRPRQRKRPETRRLPAKNRPPRRTRRLPPLTGPRLQPPAPEPQPPGPQARSPRLPRRRLSNRLLLPPTTSRNDRTPNELFQRPHFVKQPARRAGFPFSRLGHGGRAFGGHSFSGIRSALFPVPRFPGDAASRCSLF